MSVRVGVFRPQTTPLHQVSAGVKLGLLFVAGLATVLIDNPEAITAFALAWLLLLISTRPPAMSTVRTLTGLAIVSVVSGLYSFLTGDIDQAIIIAAGIFGLACLALAISSSTATGEILDLATRMARPFRWIVPTQAVGLMVALMVRAIPEVARIYSESHESARARGLERSWRATLIPTVTRSVGFAIDLGQAMHARGVSDDFRRTRRPKKGEEPEPEPTGVTGAGRPLTAEGLEESAPTPMPIPGSLKRTREVQAAQQAESEAAVEAQTPDSGEATPVPVPVGAGSVDRGDAQPMQRRRYRAPRPQALLTAAPEPAEPSGPVASWVPEIPTPAAPPAERGQEPAAVEAPAQVAPAPLPEPTAETFAEPQQPATVAEPQQPETRAEAQPARPEEPKPEYKFVGRRARREGRQ